MEPASRGRAQTAVFDTHRLRRALAAHLGHELTPERAASIATIACGEPAPLPILSAEAERVVDISQAAEHFRFINERLKAQYTGHDTVLMAHVGTNGRIRAVVAFTDFRRWSVEMAVATDERGHWLSRTFLRACCAYPFLQLGLRRVTGRVESDNARAMALNEHLGGVREGVQRQQFGENDAVLFGMLRSECPWIKE